MTSPGKPSKSKQKTRSTPTALPVIQPLVAGIDVGSTQHWVCGPAQDETLNQRIDRLKPKLWRSGDTAEPQ